MQSHNVTCLLKQVYSVLLGKNSREEEDRVESVKVTILFMLLNKKEYGASYKELDEIRLLLIDKNVEDKKKCIQVRQFILDYILLRDLSCFNVVVVNKISLV